MTKDTQLKQRIKHLVTLCSQVRTCLEIAESGKNSSDAKQTRLIATLRTDLSAFRAQGRAAVFELMLCTSHRRFMQYLREQGEAC